MKPFALLLLALPLLSPGTIKLDQSGGKYVSDLVHYAEPNRIASASTVRLAIIELERLPEAKPNGNR